MQDAKEMKGGCGDPREDDGGNRYPLDFSGEVALFSISSFAHLLSSQERARRFIRLRKLSLTLQSITKLEPPGLLESFLLGFFPGVH